MEEISCFSVKIKMFQIKKMAEVLDCTTIGIQRVFCGRCFLTFKQLETVANTLETPVIDLLDKDFGAYNERYFGYHEHRPFSNPDNREMILNIIDDFLDVKEAVTSVGT